MVHTMTRSERFEAIVAHYGDSVLDEEHLAEIRAEREEGEPVGRYLMFTNGGNMSWSVYIMDTIEACTAHGEDLMVDTICPEAPRRLFDLDSGTEYKPTISWAKVADEVKYEDD
jgi:hypothetical protein